MRRFATYFEQKHSDVRRQRKVIKEAIMGGAQTVSSISHQVDMPSELVVWNLMGMLKWGDIEVTGEKDHELVYRIKEV